LRLFSLFRSLLPVLLLSFAVSAHAFSAGDLDLDFNPGSGANSDVGTMVLQADGKVVIGGWFTMFNGVALNRIARLNSDGSVDTSFNLGTGANNTVTVIVQQTDGKILIGGDFSTVNGIARSKIARLNSDGSLDISFNPGTGSNGYVRTMALQADGKIIIGGDFNTMNGVARNRIARLNNDGSIDVSFDPGVGSDNHIFAITLQDDGKIIIGGDFITVNGAPHRGIARLNNNGSVDASFNPSVNGGQIYGTFVNAIVPQVGGEIIIGGNFTLVNGVARGNIARLNRDGSLDSIFNSSLGSNSGIFAVVTQVDGKVIIGGYFTAVNGLVRNRIARLNSDGEIDTSFAPSTGENNSVLALALQTDGKIILGGRFATINGVARNKIARIHTGDLDNDGIEDAADVFPNDSTESFDTDHDGIGNNTDIDDDGDDVLDVLDNCPLLVNVDQLNTDGDAQGDLCDSDADNDGVPNSYDVFPLDPTESIDLDYDGVGDNADTDDDNDGVLDVLDNCLLLVNAGQLNTDGDAQGNICDTDDDDDGVLDVVDACALDNSASIGNNDNDVFCDLNDPDDDNDGIQDVLDNCPLQGNADQLNTDGDAQGNICDSDDDNDGVADSSDKFPLNVAVSLDADNDGAAESWNAACDSACQAVSGLVLDNCVGLANPDQSNDDGDVAGNPCDSDGPGKTDTGFNAGTGADGAIEAVVVDANGQVIIGGYFTKVAGVTRNRIARLNANGSLDTGFNPGTGASDGVLAIAVQPDGKVVVAGGFGSVNGVTRGRIARLNSDGSLDMSFNSSVGADSSIYAVALQPDGKVLIGGYFSNVNGVAKKWIARLNADGSLDASFDLVDINSYVSTIALQGNKILIGGVFYRINGVGANYIARLNADGSLDSSFNSGSGSNNSVKHIVAQNDGKIIIGGSFSSINSVSRSKLARLDSDGSLDASFNPTTGPNSSVQSIVAQADGKIVVGGLFTSANGLARKYIARYNADGAIDIDFNSSIGANQRVQSLALQTSGQLIAAGYFTTYNSVTANRIVGIHTGDADQDSIENAADAFSNDPVEQYDTDHDGIGNNTDTDDDGDSIQDVSDNCPLNANTNQLDTDSDTLGDVCDSDDDDDGSVDGVDACPLDATAFTGNIDWDYECDVVDADDDNDGTPDVVDNCPLIANIDQLNTDGDVQGNVCDADDDNDGVIDSSDKFPLDVTESLDADQDGIGDNSDTDDDNDSVLDVVDNCPLIANIDQLNTDVDAQGNICDTDDDNDGVVDGTDKFPLNAASSSDADNDGYPGSWNISCDASCQIGSGLTLDNCPSSTNINQLNTDGDTHGDACDSDDDNDGVADTSDAFPLDATESLDIDHDGIGNNADDDDDGDGFVDASDNCPLYANFAQEDDDRDGFGNQCDSDGPGKLDFSFNPSGGADGFISAVGTRPNGDMLFGGSFAHMNGVYGYGIALVNASASLDATFHPNLGGAVSAIALQSDGKWIIGGNFNKRITRINADGSVDSTFNIGAGANGQIFAVAIQSDGKIIIGGDFTSVNGTSRNRIARLNLDGSLDLEFNIGSGINDRVYTLGLQADGKILIGGKFTTVNGVARSRIARINIDGSIDSFFNFSVSDAVRSLAIQKDGKILFVGDFTFYPPPQGVANNTRILRLNSDGSLDSSFNAGSNYTNGTIVSVILQADGKIIIGGAFNTFRGISRPGIARLNANGTMDGNFDPGDGASQILAMAIDVEGKLVVGGSFSSYNSTVINNIARIHTGDVDNDGIEDAADFDRDNDGVVDSQDIFPFDPTESIDTDGDGIGNNADTDDDNDSVADESDALPLDSTETIDTDHDGIGNNTDTDDDNDGVTDTSDAFPLDATESVDTDGDGIGNNSDTTPNGDADSDGVDNSSDNCAAVSNTDQLNTDGDAQGNACDTDDDNDGVADSSDAFPLDATESVDTDSDGIGDNADTTPNGDTDSDGVDNIVDNCPSVANANQLNTDGDTQGDACDTTPNGDIDSDGIDNATDNCRLVANADQLNTDGDAQGDACDILPLDEELLLQQNGSAKNENFAASIAMADMNGDGVVDILMGSPMSNVTIAGKVRKKVGVIRIVSGKDNSVLRTLNGTAVNQQFGTAIAVVADQNSDSVPDIIVGEPLADITTIVLSKTKKLKDAGRVVIVSGSDGALLNVLAEGKHAGDHFGAAVAVGNINNDTEIDLVVGAPLADSLAKNAGQITAFIGLSDNMLYQRYGDQAGENFGAAIAIDDEYRLFVGSPLRDVITSIKLTDAGRVRVFPANNGDDDDLLTLEGSAARDHFGAAISASNDDVNADSELDWAVGAPLADSNGKDAGRVQIFSGLNITPIATLNGKAASDNFGSALNMQGDVNQDGKNDIAVGINGFDIPDAKLIKNAGSVQVLSGAAF
jgi:uncharacterized delta-60 repeat protein